MVSIRNTENIERSSTIRSYSDTASSSTSGSDFSAQLEQLLTNSGKDYFTEKEIFSAIAEREISSNPEALEVFRNAYNESLQSYGADKKRAVLYATNRAIKATRVAGYLSRQEAHQLRARALGAAQMDNNPYRLGTASLSEGDQKYALKDILSSATQKMNNYNDGTEVAILRRDCRRILKELKYGSANVADSTDGKIRTTYTSEINTSQNNCETNEVLTDKDNSDLVSLSSLYLSAGYFSNYSDLLTATLLGDDKVSDEETSKGSHTKKESEDLSDNALKDTDTP